MLLASLKLEEITCIVDAGSLFTAPYYDNEGSALGLSLGSGTLAGKNMVKYISQLENK